MPTYRPQHSIAQLHLAAPGRDRLPKTFLRLVNPRRHARPWERRFFSWERRA
jgi:hypothetical protein